MHWGDERPIIPTNLPKCGTILAALHAKARPVACCDGRRLRYHILNTTLRYHIHLVSHGKDSIGKAIATKNLETGAQSAGIDKTWVLYQFRGEMYSLS